MFDFVDVKAVHRRIDERLRPYVDAFQEAAEENEVAWTLLAAQAYQESHWDPLAKSPTGVRGMMMLTQVTAKEVGIDDRLDPIQSIQGGAVYLRRMLNRVEKWGVNEDAMAFALAAYNVGFGHLQDARKLTESDGADPNRWADVAERLPLLSDPEYFSQTRYGYARGSEPVRYVRRIRGYRETIQHRSGELDLSSN